MVIWTTICHPSPPGACCSGSAPTCTRSTWIWNCPRKSPGSNDTSSLCRSKPIERAKSTTSKAFARAPLLPEAWRHTKGVSAAPPGRSIGLEIGAEALQFFQLSFQLIPKRCILLQLFQLAQKGLGATRQVTQFAHLFPLAVENQDGRVSFCLLYTSDAADE